MQPGPADEQGAQEGCEKGQSADEKALPRIRAHGFEIHFGACHEGEENAAEAGDVPHPLDLLEAEEVSSHHAKGDLDDGCREPDFD